MHTNLKKETLANANQLTEKEKYAQELVAYALGKRPDCPKKPKSPPENKIATILQEADKALLVGKHIIAHNCIQLAIAELMEKEKEPK